MRVEFEASGEYYCYNDRQDKTSAKNADNRFYVTHDKYAGLLLEAKEVKSFQGVKRHFIIENE